MIDLPAPLPTCTEVILSMKEAFSDWDLIGTFQNNGVEVYAYKLDDTGEGATYTRLMFTPNPADVQWGLKTQWRLVKEATCIRDGRPVWNLILTTEVKEKA